MEGRVMTRWEMHKYARAAYDMGIRYIGGCCGFEPYHIRAIAEEVMWIYFLAHEYLVSRAAVVWVLWKPRCNKGYISYIGD